MVVIAHPALMQLAQAQSYLGRQAAASKSPLQPLLPNM